MNRPFGVPALAGFRRPAAWRSFTRSGPPEGGTPNKRVRTDRFMVPMHAKSERGLAMNLIAQPSRLRVAAASRLQHEPRAGRPLNSQARTPARHGCGCGVKMGLVVHASLGPPTENDDGPFDPAGRLGGYGKIIREESWRLAPSICPLVRR